jgi:hypothetical protein
MILVQAERSPFAGDLCRCSRCGGVLSRYDHGFNALGQTLELCPNCPPRLMLMRTRVPIVKQTPKVHHSHPEMPRCGCGVRLKRKNALRCDSCRVEHRKAQHRAYTASYALMHKDRKHRAVQ